MALPYDVAALIKHFSREIPSPLFPSSEMHEALLQAQALPNEDTTLAFQLLLCLPESPPVYTIWKNWKPVVKCSEHMKVFYDLVHGEPFVDCNHPMDVLGKSKPNCMVLQIFFVSCVVS